MREVVPAGYNLIMEFEGFRADPYVCPGGKLTVGYGHVIRQHEDPEVMSGLSERDAMALLRVDVMWARKAVETRVKVALTDNQFAALVSFVYNLGPYAFKRSTLLRKLNSGDYAGASNEFRRWRMAGGKVLRGLERRRAAEAALFRLTSVGAARQT